jgi:hypothetical protein
VNADTDSLHWDPCGERRVALCRNAHLGVERQDEIDYWYRLGQRDAYAYAAGVVIAREVDSEAFSVAERLTGALTQGVADLAALRSVVLNPVRPEVAVEAGLAWRGLAAFHAQFPPGGLDHDFGMRWGANGDQRLSLRLPAGREDGLLYAYDPTWDEYAVLCRNASSAAVEGAFARALQSDIHMSPACFAALVAQEPPTPAPVDRAAGMPVQL